MGGKTAADGGRPLLAGKGAATCVGEGMNVDSGVATAEPGAVDTAGCSEGEMPAELVLVEEECENSSGGGGGGGAVKPGAGGRIAPNEGEY